MVEKPRLSIDIYNQYVEDDHVVQWPDDPTERVLLARALFGRQLIAKFDSWIKHALDFLENPARQESFQRNSKIDLENKYFRAGLQNLEPAQNKVIRDLICTTVQGMLFSALVTLDQSPFGKYELLLMPSQTKDSSGISLFTDLPDQLHDELNDWIVSFSGFSNEIVELVQHPKGWWQFQPKDFFRS